jgi:hypothetical protein
MSDVSSVNDFDYLVQDTDKSVLKNLAAMGEKLKELKSDMDAKEAAFAAAKKEYEYYAGSILPMEMYNAGVNSIELMTGGVMSYERKYYCTPNKNANDKATIARWLQEHDGAHLIKETAVVPGAKIDDLKEAGIPFTEIDDINTNSLKAFLKDKLGVNGGTAQITITDIPLCVHFQEVGQVTIDV